MQVRSSVPIISFWATYWPQAPLSNQRSRCEGPRWSRYDNSCSRPTRQRSGCTIRRFSRVLKSKSGALFRSFLIPGWGQSYNLEPTKAWVFGGVEALVAAALWAHLDYQSKNDTYCALEVGGDFTAAAQSAEKAYELRNSILIGALVHAVNIVDAYLSGVDANNQTAQVHLALMVG